MDRASVGLAVAKAILLAPVRVGWPLDAATGNTAAGELRGLDPRRGLVGAVPARAIPGLSATALVLLPFSKVADTGRVDSGPAAFGTLRRSAVGFRLGGRSATSWRNLGPPGPAGQAAP